MKIKFDVTQEDIENGRCMVASECAVILSIKRTLGIKKESCGSAFSDISFYGFKTETPKHLLSWIREYDRYRKKKSKPTIFVLDIPDSVLEQIGYFDQKGTSTVETYINEKSSKQQRRITVLEKETDRGNLIHA